MWVSIKEITQPLPWHGSPQWTISKAKTYLGWRREEKRVQDKLLWTCCLIFSALLSSYKSVWNHNIIFVGGAGPLPGLTSCLEPCHWVNCSRHLTCNALMKRTAANSISSGSCGWFPQFPHILLWTGPFGALALLPDRFPWSFFL